MNFLKVIFIWTGFLCWLCTAVYLIAFFFMRYEMTRKFLALEEDEGPEIFQEQRRNAEWQ